MLPRKAGHRTFKGARAGTLAVWRQIARNRPAVEAYLERISRNSPQLKADRRALLTYFLATRSYAAAAKACGVTKNASRNVMVAAARHLRDTKKKGSASRAQKS